MSQASTALIEKRFTRMRFAWSISSRLAIADSVGVPTGPAVNIGQRSSLDRSGQQT
jgi:hypothetical protein